MTEYPDICYTGYMTAENPQARITVTQYRGPTMHFESAKEYADWLISGGHDPDFAVDLHETWRDPTQEAADQQEIEWRVAESGL